MPSSDIPTICPYCSRETSQNANQAKCSDQDDHEFWFYISAWSNNVIWYIKIDEYIISAYSIKSALNNVRPSIFKFDKPIPLDQAVNTLKRFIAMKAFS
jgi:hypothetical protein